MFDFIKDTYQERIENTSRGTIILLVCVILVILLVLLSLLIWTTSHNEPAIHSQTASKPKTNENIAIITPANEVSVYQGNGYTVRYPNGWNQDKKELDNNTGTVLTMQPSVANSDVYSTISLEVLNAQIDSVGTVEDIFRALHYNETNDVVAGITAQKYTAIISSQNGNLHSIVYVFKQNEKIYILKLEYIQPGVNEQLESQFDQTVRSFSLQ